MDREYIEVYRELYQRHWWWRSRTEFIVDKLRELRPAAGWKQILDIGCGDALFFERLSVFGEVEGVEPCAEMVSPENPYRERIYIGPFDKNFHPEHQFSLILMLDVLEHLDDPVAALTYVRDLLTPEGILMATVPACMLLWTNHDVLNHHRTRYTKQRLREIATQAGLRIQEEGYLYRWVFPLKLAARIMENIFHRKPAVPKAPPSWVNQAAFWISRIEQKSLRLLPVPFGSSLMVIATKPQVKP